MIHQNIFMSNTLDGAMRVMVKTEVCDQPSVRCDCDARRPKSVVRVRAGSANFSVWITTH